MPLTVEAAREADRAEAQLLLLRMGIAQCLNGGYANGATWLGTVHGQAAWIPALGCVERKGTPDWNTPPPSGVLISGLSSPAGAVSFERPTLRSTHFGT